MHRALREVSYNLSVLYVEDDDFMLGQLSAFMGKFFKRVVTANNGQEAYALYKQDKFDIVITDIDMPIMDGLQLIDAIKKKDPFQPIVVSSGKNNDNDLLISLLNSRICGFLKKPIDMGEFKKILIKVCGLIQDQLILAHYVEELERLQREAMTIECRPTCPMREVLSQPIEPLNNTQPAAAADDDDFFYFDSPQAIRHDKDENIAAYKDYFSQLAADDKEELVDILGDIDSVLLIPSGQAVDIPRLGNLVQRYGNVLLHYQFFSDMGSTIVELGSVIGSEGSSIYYKPDEAKGLIGGFCSVLQNFMKEVWEVETNNPKFFNDSIINDARTIIDIISPPKAAASDDLVFF